MDAIVVVISDDAALGEMMSVALSLSGYEPVVYKSFRDALGSHSDPIVTVIATDSTTVGDRDAARLRHAHPNALIVAGVPSERDPAEWADMTVPIVELGLVPQLLAAPQEVPNVIDLSIHSRRA